MWIIKGINISPIILNHIFRKGLIEKLGSVIFHFALEQLKMHYKLLNFLSSIFPSNINSLLIDWINSGSKLFDPGNLHFAFEADTVILDLQAILFFLYLCQITKRKRRQNKKNKIEVPCVDIYERIKYLSMKIYSIFCVFMWMGMNMVYSIYFLFY